MLIERLERQAGQTRDLDAALIGRYATKAILDKVKTLYGMGSDSWDCAATDGFIRYFLRVDHEYGLRILSTKGSFCTAESLREIAALKRQPDVQPIFIERLYASEPLQARSAMALQSQLIQSLTDTRRWTLTEGESTEVKELTLVAAR